MQPEFLILLVDDDPLLRDVLDRASRSSFAEAKTYINELDWHGPKLVLLDIDLGSDQTGFNFLTFLSSHREGRFLPVVMLTVDHLESTISQAYIVGAS